MNNFREVNDDILKEWFESREDNISALKSVEDRKHQIYLEEIGRNILRNVPKHKHKYVKKQLDLLENSIIIISIIGMRSIIEMDLRMG